jgi:hypothetical protein
LLHSDNLWSLFTLSLLTDFLGCFYILKRLKIRDVSNYHKLTNYPT